MARKVGKKYGLEGAYYVDGKGFAGQDHEPNVIDHNRPPTGQPGLWCQWTPTEDGMAIEWDGGEKFYEYVAWINYLIEHFLAPRGYKLTGDVRWCGEDSDDIGMICIKNNKVKTKIGKIVYR